MASPRVAIFPGSFDPPTLGHVDVIRRAAALFDTLIVALLTNPAKQPYFTADERIALLRAATEGMGNVKVEAFAGLLVDYARSRHATTVVRGIRSGADLDYERQLAETNRYLHPALDTVFLIPSAAVAHISSTLVREIAGFGGSVRGLVPDAVVTAIAQRSQAGRTLEV